MSSRKVSVSIDRFVYVRAERLRATTGETRSALIGRALRGLLRDEARARDVEKYVDAHRRAPETAVDEKVARRNAKRGIASLEWDDRQGPDD